MISAAAGQVQDRSRTGPIQLQQSEERNGEVNLMFSLLFTVTTTVTTMPTVRLCASDVCLDVLVSINGLKLNK